MPNKSKNKSSNSNHHHHRAGGLHQTHKKNKRKGGAASKRSLARAAGGKVNNVASASSSSNTMLAQSKAERRNQQQQKRQAKKQELLRKKRGMTTRVLGTTQPQQALSPPPPRVVGIISLSSSADDNTMTEERLCDFILTGADRVVRPNAGHQDYDTPATVSPVINCKFDVHKKKGNLTLLTCCCCSRSACKHDDDDAVMAALDLARVCDVLLLVIDGGSSGRPRIMTDNNNNNNNNNNAVITEIHLDDDQHHHTHDGSTTKKPQDLDYLISERGDRILTAIKGQGLPTPLTILAHTEKDIADGGGGDDDDDDHMTLQSTKSLRRSNIKRRLELKRYVSRFATTEFGTANDKVIEVDLTCMDDDGDGDDEDMNEDKGRPSTTKTATAASASAALVRTLCSMSCSPPKWVASSPRSFILSDSPCKYNEATQELHLTGYIRGMAPFDCHSLVHVPNLGTFACKSISKSHPPLARNRKKGDIMDQEDGRNEIKPDPERMESLDMFATPDALMGEQNLIGFEADNDYNMDEQQPQQRQQDDEKFARPAGWSDYQSAWLDAVDGEDAVDDAVDHGELAEELNRKPTKSDSDAMSVTTDAAMDLDDANDVNAQEKQALFEARRKEQSEHQEFPDEVDVDEDVNARDRFARYRSLKSFRKSYWDPKENLPETYASIFHFPSFKATQRSVMNDMKDVIKAAEATGGQFWGASPTNNEAKDIGSSMENDSDEDEELLAGCVPSGSYVTLVLRDVPANQMKALSNQALVTAVSLLPHENKVSVLHMGLSQTWTCDPTNDVPVKSKDVLTFRCGWRTWKARPVFSQNNLNCDKHKFERYMPQSGAFFVASVFGPVTYTPCPVMVFRENNDDDGVVAQGERRKKELIAIGSMIGADADRIVVKRIVLTGYPVRVHKRTATVKYMFYQPDDVKWFKPAGLYTKHGLQGNIVQSVGEHGTMKCLFNASIKQHDTVCLPLYKRIYPKFAPEEDDARRDDKSHGQNLLVVR